MKLTPAQNALLAGLATLLVTSLSEFLAGIRPFLANGKIDWNGVGIFIVGTALPTLGAGVVTYISTHQQQILQAAEDTAQQLHIPAASINTIHALLGEIKGLLVSQQNTPPTVVVQQPTPVQPQQQAPLQGMVQAAPRVAQSVAQFVAPQRASAPQPQPTPTPQPQPQLQQAFPSQDTTPRVAALLAQFQNQNQQPGNQA